MSSRWVVALSILGACGANPAGDDQPVDGGTNDVAVGRGSEALEVTPPFYDRFGTTVVGVTTQRTLTVTAHAPVTGLTAHLTRAGYTLAASDCPDALGADESCHLEIVFHPLGEGRYDGARGLVLRWHDAGGDQELATGLGGFAVPRGRSPGLVVQGEIRFPPTVLGESTTLRIPVVNTGSTPARVSVIPFEAPGLSYAADGSCEPSVQPGEGCSVAVTFTPATWGCVRGGFQVDGAWTTVNACTARREERGRARLGGVGRFLRDGDGFVFTDERPPSSPGPTPGEVHRLLPDGRFDPAWGDRGRLVIGTHTYIVQGLRALSPGHFLWFARTVDGTDLALVSDGVAGEVVHVDGCQATDAAPGEGGAIGLLCEDVEQKITVIQRHADLSPDLAFGRPTVLTAPASTSLYPFALVFDAPRQRWIAGVYAYSTDLHLRLAAVDVAGLPDPAYVPDAVPGNYDYFEPARIFVEGDALFVEGVVQIGGARAVTVVKVLTDGRVDPGFGAVVLPPERSDEIVGSARLLPLVPSGEDRVAFLSQRHRLDGSGSRWVAIGCDAAGVCHQEERVALSKHAALPFVLEDGARWMAAAWQGHGTFNWTYYTIALSAVRDDGSLDPTFTNTDDATSPLPGGVAPWRVQTDASGAFYVAAHDVLGAHRQPRVTRYDATGVLDPTFDFRLPSRAPDSVCFWDLFGHTGGETLNGRNLDLAVATDGSGVLASFDGNARTLRLDAFLPGGAVDAGFGDGGTLALEFPLDEDSRRGGPFGVILVRVSDGSYWVSINATVGLLRHVSARGVALGDWIEPGLYSLGAMLAAGDDLLVFGQGGARRILPSGERIPIGGRVDTNATAALTPDGGYLVAGPCVSRFTADGLPADGLAGPVFGDAGTFCPGGSTYEAARALVVHEEAIDLYTNGRRIRLSPDGQRLADDTFAPDLLRDVAPTQTGTLVIGRDPQSRLIVAAGP